VRWSENIAFQYPVDIAATAPYWTNADTSFTIEGWMFKNLAPDGKSIYVINHSFTTVSAMETYEVMKTFEETFITDTFAISARPQSLIAAPFTTYIGSPTVSGEKEFIVTGKMLDYVQSIYLSSADWNMFDYTTTGDFVTSGPVLVSSYSVSSFAASASYPPFSGVELLSANWSTDENHANITFTPQQTGIFDIVLVNQAGYSIMSLDCVRPTLNPYRAGTDEYNNYIEYQYPCTSGIQVLNIN
jgi:hypothetical protein